MGNFVDSSPPPPYQNKLYKLCYDNKLAASHSFLLTLDAKERLRQLFYQNSINDYTAVHNALSNNAESTLIHLMLHSSTSQTDRPRRRDGGYHSCSLFSLSDSDGSLPLHRACVANTHIDVFKLLIFAHPKGLRETLNYGELPSDLLRQRLHMMGDYDGGERDKLLEIQKLVHACV